LQELITKSKNANVNVENIIGDAACSEKENIEYANENNIKLIAKICKKHKRNPAIFAKDCNISLK